jgi:hypothetical protein
MVLAPVQPTKPANPSTSIRKTTFIGTDQRHERSPHVVAVAKPRIRKQEIAVDGMGKLKSTNA